MISSLSSLESPWAVQESAHSTNILSRTRSSHLTAWCGGITTCAGFINFFEKVTGRDLDGDGDVGEIDPVAIGVYEKPEIGNSSLV